eukprot:TRINITY_DN49105_c0_g1_i1.p1 TRINITY_DN49105_c0_g1~~TRINITY_DN49105_c0_g1_i1.p1  ORF type:complete len:196 (-),score=42.65 TRINITY_DN49105_c0_g1_i1:44-631(-)
MALLIGISGATRCGKGQLSANLSKELEQAGLTCTVVGQDRFATCPHRVKLPPGSAFEARYEYTDSIDFGAFIKAVDAARQRSQVVVVEGFRAFHESGKLLADGVSLTQAMALRFWLEIGYDTCHQRRMSSTKVPQTLFDKALWPCHLKYKEEVFSNVEDGVTGPIMQIPGDLTYDEILEQAMEQLRPLIAPLRKK